MSLVYFTAKIMNEVNWKYTYCGLYGETGMFITTSDFDTDTTVESQVVLVIF